MPSKMLQREGLVIALFFITTFILIDSEIPENLLIVDVSPVLLRGYDAMLKCQFYGNPRAVFWLKGADLATAANLVTWYPLPRGISGSGYESGKYNLTEDFSLVIKYVDESDAGRYICRISDFRGYILRNFTNATVQIAPQPPFPTVDACPTGAPQPCVVTLEMDVDSTNLTCRTMGASRGLVTLSWFQGGLAVPLQSRETPNNDSVTWDVEVTTVATPSINPYVCVAKLISAATSINEVNVSITVQGAHVVTTPTTEAFMTTNATGSQPNSGGIQIVISVTTPLAVVALIVIIAVILGILWVKWKKKRQGYQPIKKSMFKDKGKMSDYELKKLSEMLEIGSLDLIVTELMGYSRAESTKDDLYQILLDWKRESTGPAHLFYSAMEKYGLGEDLQKTEAFLGDENDTVSDQDIEHICWYVHNCKETVKPILRSLKFPTIIPRKAAQDSEFIVPSRCDEIREDLTLMKRWQTHSFEEAHPEHDNEDEGETEHGGEIVTYRPRSGETDMEAKHTKQLPSNQMIKLCRALEEAGTKNTSRDGRVYSDLAKTFYKIDSEYKSELTDEVLKQFALSITRRHCEKLGDNLKLSKADIAARNEEDLAVMFKTDIMLKQWMLDQKCSNYEIRCRLRTAANQCNRHDISDIFIIKEQSEMMSPSATLTVTDETKRSEGISSENRSDGNGNTLSPSVQQEHRGSLPGKTEAQLLGGDRPDKPGVDYVTAITREELERIGRFAGASVLLALCKEYEIVEVPAQQKPDGDELLFEAKIINTLKPRLDAEHDKIHKALIPGAAPPRLVLNDLLKEKHPRYACLLPRKKEETFFNVELFEVAFRLVMGDVHPFAVALGIKEQLLSLYKPNFGAEKYRQGTTKMIKALRTEARSDIVEELKKSGYPEEAKAFYFGFEIGLGDVVEVENRVDQVQLAQQLGVLDDNGGSSHESSTVGGECRSSFLVEWKDSVRPSTFNQRSELTDALFNMGYEELALDVMSGKYRKGAINNPQTDLLAKTISDEQLPTLCKLLDQKYSESQTCQEVITAWASNEKFFKILDKLPITLSNELLEAGFYAFAQEIMAGAWRQKEKKKATPDERKETVGNVSEEKPQEGSSASRETGAWEDRKDRTGSDSAEDTANIDKDKTDDPLGKKSKSKVDCTNVEKVESATGVESAETEQNVDITRSKPGEDQVGSQNGEGHNLAGEDANESHNIAVEVDKQGNSAKCDASGEWVIVNQEDVPQDDERQESSQDDTQNNDNQEHKAQANEDGSRSGESDNSGKESKTPITSATELSSWTKSEPGTIARAMTRL